MTYTLELTTLKAKAELVEHILYQTQGKEECILRYQKELDEMSEPCEWRVEQIQNLRLEIQAFENIMKIIAK